MFLLFLTVLEYGNQGSLEAEYRFANSSAKIDYYYNYEGLPQVYGGTINLTASGSAELNGENALVVESRSTSIVYNNIGPRSVTWVLTIVGSGGTVTASETTTIIIDETPDNIDVQETDGLIKSEDPVYTPDILPDDTVMSDLYLIDGIDIPVEIKANYPIKVDINKNDVWQDVRQI